MNDNIKALIEYYSNSGENLVAFQSGHKGFGDIKEFLDVVDFFAQRYGLGGFKSLEDFADMIDNTDPVLLNVLRIVASERDERQWGGGDKDDAQNTRKTSLSEPNRGSAKATQLTGNTGHFILKKVLNDFGVSSGDLKKASADIAQRKIEFKDYGWVNSTELKTMSEEKFKATLKDMSADNRKAVNFNVSLDTMTLGEKRNGRK